MSRTSLAARIMALVIFLGIGWNWRLLDGQPFFFVHFLLLALFLFVLLTVLAAGATGQSVDARPRELVVILLLLGFMTWGAEQGRFVDAYTGLAFILVTFYCFRVLFANWRVTPALVMGAVSAGVLVSTVRAFGVGELITTLATITVASRLGLDALGGFNAYGFLLAIALVGLLYFLRASRSVLAKLACVVAGIYLFAYLLATLSRGGMVTFVVGTVTFVLLSSKAPYRALFLIGAGAAVLIGGVLVALPDLTVLQSRYDLLDDRSGTGRLFIWNFLFALLQDSPVSLLIGQGTGSVDFATALTRVESAHSTYIDVLFMYGVGGLALLTVFLVSSLRRVLRQPPSMERALMVAVSAQLVVGALFDSYHGAVQVGWLYGAWFALVCALDDRRQESPHAAPAPAPAGAHA